MTCLKVMLGLEIIVRFVDKIKEPVVHNFSSTREKGSVEMSLLLVGSCLSPFI